MAGDNDRDRSVEKALPGVMRQTAAGPSSACVDAETLAAWADGALSPAQAAAVETHLAGCAKCQAIVAVFAKTEPIGAPAAAPTGRRFWSLGWMLPLAAAASIGLVVWIARSGQTPAAPVSEVARVETPAAPVTPPAPEPPPTTAPKPAIEPAPAAPAPKTALRQVADKPRPAAPAPVGAASAVAAPPPPAAAPEPVPSAPTVRPTPPPPPPPAPFPPPPATLNAPITTTPPAVAPPPPPPQPTAVPVAQAPAPASESAARMALTEAPPRIVSEFIGGASVTIDGIAEVSAEAPQGRGGRGGAVGGARPAGAGGGGRGGAAATAALPPPSPPPITPMRWRIFSDGHVERSIDRGAAWTRVTLPGAPFITAGAAPNSTTCWLAGRDGVILITVGGTRFTRVDSPSPASVISIRATDANVATVTTADGRSFSTTDGGLTWR